MFVSPMEKEFADQALRGMKAEHDRLRVALDAAIARAEAAEKRILDMETAKKELLPVGALTVGFSDGLDAVIGHLRGATSEPDFPADERATLDGIVHVFEACKKELVETYSIDTAPTRAASLRIEPCHG